MIHTRRTLADADDVAAVLHGRVERWNEVVTSRRRSRDDLIAGLIPRAKGVADPDMARALAERDQAMQGRARALAERAVEAQQGWLRRIGAPPSDPIRRERWMQEVSTVAAYRDLHHITSDRTIGTDAAVGRFEQRGHRQRVQAAIVRAVALGRAETGRPETSGVNVSIEVHRGVEL